MSDYEFDFDDEDAQINSESKINPNGRGSVVVD